MSPPSAPDLWIILLVFWSSLAVVTVPSLASTACVLARNRCTARLGCSMALHNFLMACDSVRDGSADYCTDRCMKALVSLVTVDNNIGVNYVSCDCGGNVDCELVSRRIKTCSDAVLSALETLDSAEVISCSLARMLCEADTQCFTALTFYEKHCEPLWLYEKSGRPECTSSCNSSAAVLFRQTRGVKLKDCVCDSSDPVIDESTCRKMRLNTDRLCLRLQPKRPYMTLVAEKQPAGSLSAVNHSRVEHQSEAAAVISSAMSHDLSSFFIYPFLTVFFL